MWTVVWFVVLGGAAVGTGFWLRVQWDIAGALAGGQGCRGATWRHRRRRRGALKSAGVDRECDRVRGAELADVLRRQPCAPPSSAFRRRPRSPRCWTILRTGKPVEHQITIAEGLTAKQIDAVLLTVPRRVRAARRGPARGQRSAADL